MTDIFSVLLTIFVVNLFFSKSIPLPFRGATIYRIIHNAMKLVGSKVNNLSLKAIT